MKWTGSRPVLISFFFILFFIGESSMFSYVGDLYSAEKVTDEAKRNSEYGKSTHEKKRWRKEARLKS